ncbi:hypothetical protein [Pseudonocardia hydrocarbonoxydans]|uniref:Uncharacterized protein n=1 Tax=Pseudonocardia hydrocarbonoxydans TaxID=76726 RepID=A0A4Y3WN13_9PSEU|nr:hypothetical protein [Pseudonocardia hydrocarbonoxydans]GEC20185.1 hypothetical protein PHY01_24680 [Pseudonocardia hydrocarbonoxydans]
MDQIWDRALGCEPANRAQYEVIERLGAERSMAEATADLVARRISIETTARMASWHLPEGLRFTSAEPARDGSWPITAKFWHPSWNDVFEVVIDKQPFLHDRLEIRVQAALSLIRAHLEEKFYSNAK